MGVEVFFQDKAVLAGHGAHHLNIAHLIEGQACGTTHDNALAETLERKDHLEEAEVAMDIAVAQIHGKLDLHGVGIIEPITTGGFECDAQAVRLIDV
jgi:hypothetical protein